MSDLRKYQISAAHTQAVRASGFDIDHPDRRHAVANPLMQKLGHSPPARDNRAQALLNARNGQDNPWRDRALGLAFLACMLVQAGPVMAADTFLAAPASPPVVTAPPPVAIRNAILEHAVLGIFGGVLILASLIALVRLPHKKRTSTMPIRSKKLVTAADAEMGMPKPQWVVDAASRMGKIRRENQDAFRVIGLAGGRTALIVCDGAGGVAGGKVAAVTAVETLSSALSAEVEARNQSWAIITDKAFTAARIAVDENPDAGITTAIVAILDEARVYYATLGDGALALVWPDGMVQQLLAPHHHLDESSNVITGYLGDECDVAPRIGSLHVEHGTSILAMTDGASELFPFDAFAQKRAEYQAGLDVPETELADNFLAALEAAREPQTGAYLHHDNMTIAVAYLPEERDHG